MWGLLPPAALSKEGGYYISILSCAIHMLKKLHLHNIPVHESNNALEKTSSPFLRIFVPDEQKNQLSQPNPVQLSVILWFVYMNHSAVKATLHCSSVELEKNWYFMK